MHREFMEGSMVAFTDGAISKGCSCGSAVIGYFQNEKLDLGCSLVHSRIAKNSTNNEAELNGILMAIKNLPKNNLTPHFIFSDSEYCINSLTKWIFNWYNSYAYNIINDIPIHSMKNSSNSEVKNIGLICEIISYIANNNINIRFINVRGHKSPNNEKQVIEQAQYYYKSNKYSINKDQSIFCCKYNDIVDRVASGTSIDTLKGRYDQYFNNYFLRVCGIKSITINGLDEFITIKNDVSRSILSYPVMSKYKECIGGQYQ